MLLKAEINAAKHAKAKASAAAAADKAKKKATHDAMAEALKLMESMNDGEDQEQTLDSYGDIIKAYGNTR